MFKSFKRKKKETNYDGKIIKINPKKNIEILLESYTRYTSIDYVTMTSNLRNLRIMYNEMIEDYKITKKVRKKISDVENKIMEDIEYSKPIFEFNLNKEYDKVLSKIGNDDYLKKCYSKDEIKNIRNLRNGFYALKDKKGDDLNSRLYKILQKKRSNK